MNEKPPPPNAEDLPVGTLIVTRHQPRTPVHVLEVIPYPGASVGFLVRHDGPGVRCLDGADVRIWKAK